MVMLTWTHTWHVLRRGLAEQGSVCIGLSQPTPPLSRIISVYGIFISHEPEFLNFQHIPGNKSIAWPSHPTIVSAANLEL